MKSTRVRTWDGAKMDGKPAVGARVRRTYVKPELVSYGSLVDLTRNFGGGAPDGLIGTIGT